MNLQDLQRKQQELDSFIIKTKNITISKEHLLSNTFLAAIDELSNEVREDISNPEEWIDVLHFVLSISNQLGYTLSMRNASEGKLDELLLRTERALLRALRLSKCFKHWSNSTPNQVELTWVGEFLSGAVSVINVACEVLNVDMYEEYEKKYKINIERQKNNY